MVELVVYFYFLCKCLCKCNWYFLCYIYGVLLMVNFICLFLILNVILIYLLVMFYLEREGMFIEIS